MDVLSRFLRSPKSQSDVSHHNSLMHCLKDRTWTCPSCGYLQQEDSGALLRLPAGLKFEQSDEEVMRHLQAKLRIDNCVPHPLLDDFILTIKASQGICHTHPENLPGVSRDGSKRHFFHAHPKAYKNGNKKRRRIVDDCEYRWHKTGKTRTVFVEGKQLGLKKILVLYSHCTKNGETHKTNWVMHQYHLSKGANEKDNELVVSKIFYQGNNSGALPKSATKQAVQETCNFNILATGNSAKSATEQGLQTSSETYSPCSLGITSFENRSKLCEVAGSNVSLKVAIDPANSWISLKNETDNDGNFEGIGQNSSFVNQGCPSPHEDRDFTEWFQYYYQYFHIP